MQPPPASSHLPSSHPTERASSMSPREPSDPSHGQRGPCWIRPPMGPCRWWAPRHKTLAWWSPLVSHHPAGKLAAHGQKRRGYAPGGSRLWVLGTRQEPQPLALHQARRCRVVSRALHCDACEPHGRVPKRPVPRGPRPWASVYIACPGVAPPGHEDSRASEIDQCTHSRCRCWQAGQQESTVGPGQCSGTAAVHGPGM